MKRNIQTDTQEKHIETDLGLFPKSWKILEQKEFLIPQVRIKPKPIIKYKSIGILSHGKGTFLKLDCYPKKIALTKLYEVKAGDLVTNITFAWEGAIAIAKEEDDSALVSHRFPTFTFRHSLVNPNFFQYIIIQKWYVNQLRLISPGSAGRNRVLNKKFFLKIKVPIPTPQEQEKIGMILELIRNDKEKTETVIISLKTLKKSLMKYLYSYGISNFKDINSIELRETEIGLLPIKWGIKKVSELSKVKYGKSKPKEKGNIPVVGSSGVYSHTSKSLINFPTIVIGRKGNAGKPWLILTPCFPSDTTFYLEWKDKIDLKYLFEYITLNPLSGKYAKTTLPSLKRPDLEKLKIPYPPLPEQQQIASILSIVDNKIEVEEKRKESLNELFKSMLHNLMSAKIRVNHLEV